MSYVKEIRGKPSAVNLHLPLHLPLEFIFSPCSHVWFSCSLVVVADLQNFAPCPAAVVRVWRKGFARSKAELWDAFSFPYHCLKFRFDWHGVKLASVYSLNLADIDNTLKLCPKNHTALFMICFTQIECEEDASPVLYNGARTIWTVS